MKIETKTKIFKNSVSTSNALAKTGRILGIMSMISWGAAILIGVLADQTKPYKLNNRTNPKYIK